MKSRPRRNRTLGFLKTDITKELVHNLVEYVERYF